MQNTNVISHETQKIDVTTDPLDFMSLEELDDLQNRIRKVLLRKAIEEIMQRKKTNKEN